MILSDNLKQKFILSTLAFVSFQINLAAPALQFGAEKKITKTSRASAIIPELADEPVSTEVLASDLELITKPAQTVATVLLDTDPTSQKPKRRYGPRKSKLKKILFEDKLFVELNEQELASRCQDHLAINDYRAAALCTEREITLCKDPKRLRQLRLNRAEYWQKSDDVEKAAGAYREFVLQYPSYNKTEYAKYQLIKILFNEMPVCNRDQTGTRESLKTAQDFLANPSYQQYRQEVEQMAQRCRRQLLDSEIKVFEFYINHQHLIAAQKRLVYIQQHFPEFSTQLVVLKEWLTAVENGQNYILPKNMRSKKSRKHSYAYRF